MKPLGEDFIKLQNWDDELGKDVANGSAVGFLIDSSVASLRRSGLIKDPDSVIPLDTMLSAKSARIYYIDPRKLDRQRYISVTKKFQESISDAGFFSFELEPPSLIMMRRVGTSFVDLQCLSFDEKCVCLWYVQTHEFLSRYLSNSDPVDQPGGSLKRLVKRYTGTVVDESLKLAVAGVVAAMF